MTKTVKSHSRPHAGIHGLLGKFVSTTSCDVRLAVAILAASGFSLPAQGQGLTTGWSQLPQEPENRREHWQYATTPVAVALSSIGQSRAVLAQRMKTQTRTGSEPVVATPRRWEYVWALDQYDFADCTVDFDAKAIVRKVTIVPASTSTNKLASIPILSLGLDPAPYFLGEPHQTPAGKTEWSLDGSKAEVYIDKRHVDDAYRQAKGPWDVRGVVDCFIVKRDPTTGAYICVTCFQSIRLITSQKRHLNVDTGVYDSQISYSWHAAAVRRIEAGTGPYPLPAGSLRVGRCPNLEPNSYSLRPPFEIRKPSH